MLNKRGFFLLCLTVCYVDVKTELVQGSCREGFKQCEIGACLSDKYICDGIVHCPDLTDEKYCETPKTKLEQGKCIDGYVECDMGEVCVQTKYVCDGEPFCPDKSDEIYCHEHPVNDQTLSNPINGITTTETARSEEEVDPRSDENDREFRLSEEADHCAHYKRMIILVRRVQMKLIKMDLKTSKHIRNLINEILMEAGMESFSSLLELHQVCSSMENGPKHHHHKHTTTTSTTTPSTTSIPPLK